MHEPPPLTPHQQKKKERKNHDFNVFQHLIEL